MKIIFDSIDQKDLFMRGCPGRFGLKEPEHCGTQGCKECWENALDYEIKDEESIEMTNKEITYTDAVYELVKDECKDLDAIYEDYIVELVGNCGLAALKRAGLLEGCGSINCRQLYALVEKGE